MKNEPVALGGAITSLAVAAIPLLRAFGVEVTEDQSTAILGMLAAVIAFGTLLVRSQVTTTTKANEVIDAAFHAHPGEEKPTL